MELRAKQQALYDWLLNYFEREGRSPTVREIMDGVGYTSPDTVRRMLFRLAAQGLITFAFREPRSIKLVGYRLVLVKEEAA